MNFSLPRYTSKDYMVLGITIIPLTLALNSVIFGSDYYSNWPHFLFATAITALSLSINFVLCVAVAVILKKRFPEERLVGTRLTLMLTCFILFTGLFLYFLFKGYEQFPFLNYTFNEFGFTWAYMGMAIVNIFFTLLHEAIARYENWKANLAETEALRKVYRQGRLLGLKSQVNPHFLFNSLNSLSSLIHEDEKKGEKFLDEMSKVYRYMLQNDEEALVPLRTELNFFESYIYLLTARHQDGLKVNMLIPDEKKDLLLPPLTLQTITENIMAQNSVCRDCPLIISLQTGNDNSLTIEHNVLPKLASDPADETDPGLENLIKKYRLLNRPGVAIETEGSSRTIHMPLISNKEEVVL
jgi:two-component system, LytTR family, sensor kinase